MKLNTAIYTLAIGIVALTAAVFFSKTAAADPIVLIPDTVTGEFTARANTNTDDFRVTQVCLFRTDVNSPDPAAEFACGLVQDGRAPSPEEVQPSGEGVVVDITFSTVLVPGENQEFVVRNLALEVGENLWSEPGADIGIIPARPIAPVFIIVSPPAP